MSDIEGRRWAIGVFGPIVLLVGVVVVGYVGLFLVPGGPCTDTGDLTAPDTEFTVASNGSAVVVIHTGNGSVGGATTDRVVVSIRNEKSPDTASREWVSSEGTIERGDTLAIPAEEIGFELSEQDRVTVQWYGVDPDVAGFCPNGRAYRELTVVRLENASTLVDTNTTSGQTHPTE